VSVTRLAVTGAGVLSPGGIGLERLTAEIAPGRGPSQLRSLQAAALYSESLPEGSFNAVADFDVRQFLGRKGTAGLYRQSALAVVVCGQALEDSGLCVDDDNRDRVGVALGTTWGSLKSISDFAKETLLANPPYLVTPTHFPNTVMNCAAGQSAIRYGLRGINATLAGGELAFLNALEFVANAVRCGHADAMLAGAIDEFTPQTAWAIHASGDTDEPAVIGEAAASFVIESFDAASASSRHIGIEVLSVSTGFCPGGAQSGRLSARLAECIGRALTKAELSANEVTCIAMCGAVGADDPARDLQSDAESRAVAAVLGQTHAERIGVRGIFGECLAATGALQMGVLLALHRADARRDGRASVMTAITRDGGYGAAILRGWSRGTRNRR
jgi:3-oxoacyl-[acyl-carrier-protein] synthase II